MTPLETIALSLRDSNQSLGVISTVNAEGLPQASSIYYVYDKDLVVYFITRKESRKYKNITQNNHVAFVVTTEHPARTFQMEGVASQVTDPHEENEHFTRLVALVSDHTFLPPVSKLSGSEMIFIKISPTWVRLGDFEVMKEGDLFVEVHL